jgi:hypothetical protein
MSLMAVASMPLRPMTERAARSSRLRVRWRAFICPLAETPITADIAASPRQHELKMLRHLQGPHRRKKPAEAGSFFSKISKVFINKTENLIKQSCQNKCASY